MLLNERIFNYKFYMYSEKLRITLWYGETDLECNHTKSDQVKSENFNFFMN